MRSTNGLELKNIARGERGYRAFRWKIYTLVADVSSFTQLGDFLVRKLVKSRPKAPFTALELYKKDFPVLNSLYKSNTGAESYLYLLTNYIKYNINDYHDINLLDRIISSAILSNGQDGEIEGLFYKSQTRRQSIFAMKAYCALFSSNSEDISRYFGSGMYSDWVRKRFLYPLSYFYSSEPDSSIFDNFLRQMYADSETLNNERYIIQILIDDNKPIICSQSFIFYISLLLHPYDAVILTVRYYESLASMSVKPNTYEINYLQEIYELTGNVRLSNIIKHFTHKHIPIIVDADITNYSGIQINDKYTKVYRNITSLSYFNYTQTNNNLLDALQRVRISRYPEISDFHDVSAWSLRHGYSSAGRFLKVYITSLYLWPRGGPHEEFLYQFYAIELFGGLTYWATMSPRGYAYLRLLERNKNLPLSLSILEINVDKRISEIEISDRRWIKVFHFEQRKLESQYRYDEWFAAIRKSMPLFGTERYICGIDWSVLDRIADTYRIKAFLGRPDAIYVLMLRQSEQRGHEVGRLRHSIAPWATGCGEVSAFAKKLASEYGENSIVFFRRYLSPSEIMQLDLESNYTAALSERLIALEYLVKEYNFSTRTITEAELEKEQKNVTSVLSLMSVNANQFEINWNSIRDEALSETQDIYKAYVPLSLKYNSLDLVSEATTVYRHLFSNKQSETYAVKHKDIYVVQMALQAIDVFLSNPANGIESVLAIRIRHDNLRREFERAVDGVRVGLNIRTVSKNSIIREYKELISYEVKEWVRKYMHTGRISPETALFSFIPQQSDVDKFVTYFNSTSSQESLISIVIEWTKSRLSSHLEQARDLLVGKLVDDISTSIERKCVDLVGIHRANDVKAAELAVIQQVKRTASELTEWFKSPESVRSSPISFRELLLAVEGRFEQEVVRGELVFSRISSFFNTVDVSPENIRNLFVAMSELTLNSVKYRSRSSVRVFVNSVLRGGIVYALYSCSNHCKEPYIRTYKGRPFGSYTEGILNSGNTGLEKIAFLAASVIGSEVEIEVYGRRRGFHVLLPIGRSGQ